MVVQSKVAIRKNIYNIFTRKYGLHIKVDAQQYLVGLLAHESDVTDYLEKIIYTYTKRYNDDHSVIIDSGTIKEVVAVLQTSAAIATGVTPFQRQIQPEVASEMDIDMGTFEDSVYDDPMESTQSSMPPMTDDDDTQATNGSVVVEQHNKKEEIINIAEHFHVVDAFSLPNLVYDEYRGTFQKSSKKGLLLADGRDKSSMFKERLLLVKQRLLRNEDFAPAMAKEASYVKLTPIKELIGHDGKFFVLLGMLTQIEQGKIHLEDAGGHIELDLSDVVYDHGLFTDGIIVIIEGTYTYDHNFKVKELGLPPPEPRHMTEALLEHIDFLGVPKPLVEHRLLLEEEIAHKDISFVILSNVYLDQPKIMTALSTLFDSYQNQLVPLAFIFIGNFSSKPFHYTPTESAKYRDNFTALGDLIGMYPEMATHTNFVFVPGPRDPWNDEILPQHPLPASFVSKLKRKLRKATFTTNPCRIRYCTQDMVIYREDLLNKLMKRTLITTNLDCDPKAVNHLIHTIVDQGHLNPLPLRTKSVYWAFDNGLRLYPLPHTLVLADSCEAYSVRYQDTLCVNPSSSIVDSRFSWTIYYPATKKTTQRWITV